MLLLLVNKMIVGDTEAIKGRIYVSGGAAELYRKDGSLMLGFDCYRRALYYVCFEKGMDPMPEEYLAWKHPNEITNTP